MLDLGIVKKDFTSLMGNIHPWMLSHFVMWLDIKVAEYKVYGHMVLDDTPNDTPKWLRGQKSQEETDTSNSNEANESWSQTEGASNRQVFPLQDGSPSSKKQSRLCSMSYVHSTSHDQHNLQQSHRTPQGQSCAQKPLPNLMRQPQIYRTDNQSTVPQPHQQSSEKVHTESNIDRNNANESHEGLQHFEERGSVQDMLDNIHLSQIQLQERWSQEIRKSVNQTGVTAIRSSSGDVQSGEKISRSAIVLNEPHQQHNQSDAASQVGSLEKDDKVSSKSPHQNIIKIELSSDEEDTQTDCYNSTLRGESTPAVYDTSQGETTSGIIDFDSKSYFLHETNLKEVANDISPHPVSLHSASDRILVREKNEDEASWRNKKWEYFEKLRKTQSSSYVGAKVHSQSLQNLLPFPDPFPLDNLQYGPRAQEMINSGVITRSGKMQFLDTVFNEVVKYTGLYPTPQQKIDIAKAIVTTFPKLDTKTHPGHSSSIDQWLVIVNDKFRNERRMLHHGPYLSRQRIPGLQYSTTNTEMKEDS